MDTYSLNTQSKPILMVRGLRWSIIPIFLDTETEISKVNQLAIVTNRRKGWVQRLWFHSSGLEPVVLQGLSQYMEEGDPEKRTKQGQFEDMMVLNVWFGWKSV